MERISSLKNQTDYLILKSRVSFEENDVKQAMEYARKAVEFNSENNPVPTFCKNFKNFLYFLDIIQAYIEMRNLKEAQNQMEFLRATHNDILNFDVN